MWNEIINIVGFDKGAYVMKHSTESGYEKITAIKIIFYTLFFIASIIIKVIFKDILDITNILIYWCLLELILINYRLYTKK